MRTEDNPGTKGPLTSVDCELVARALWKKALNNCFNFHAIAGLPHAADLFIEAIENSVIKPGGFRVIKLAKEITKDGRKIVPAPGFEYQSGERVLLFDDLLTGGDSKIEAAEAIESQGAIVAGFVI